MSGDLSTVRTSIEHELGASSAPSIIRLVDLLIEHAHRARASDIHIDPHPEGLAVCFRVDGMLTRAHLIPSAVQSEIISRIKIISGLRTDEHQAAQDGRFRVQAAGTPVDVRVSIVPTFYGENAVLRLLTERTDTADLAMLGFSEHDRAAVARTLANPHGMILATGPTGSGKTTTLYAMLKILAAPEISVVTIEDPIEYAIGGIRQIQVNERTGLTFAAGLRSIVRQDPDVIMVGEIRDSATAGLAVNAALTGHRLLSTLHTNDAVTTLVRLADMGVEPFLIASTVRAAIGQRLVRRICESCKVPDPVGETEWHSIAAALVSLVSPTELTERKQFFKGSGCVQCNTNGYVGRIAVSEMLEVNDPVRDAIMRRASAHEVKSIAVEGGMRTITQDALDKALAGLTTVHEVLRIMHE